MQFTKRFGFGLIMMFFGVLTAFNYVSDYRVWSIVFFWTAMAISLAGLVMMFNGVRPRKMNGFK
ncbi:hypothetical protein K1X84_15755 [bacterium]|nr:hypothetical protein [bacterium]